MLINDYEYKCIVIAGLSDTDFWTKANEIIVSEMQSLKPERTIERLIVQDGSFCVKLRSFSWKVPGEEWDPALFSARRDELKKQHVEAALLLASGSNMSVIRVSNGKSRVEVAGSDPRELTTGNLRCKLLLIYGGGQTEIPGVVWASAYIQCNKSDLRHEEGREILEQIRRSTRIGSPSTSRLLVAINTCASFPEAAFPVQYVFSDDEHVRECTPDVKTSISSNGSRICVPTDEGRSECNFYPKPGEVDPNR
jgi:hypothetical protein